MTYSGHVENGKVVFDEPAPLADGTSVRISVACAPAGPSEESGVSTLADRLAPFLGAAKGLPADWSENHDKYLREEHGR